MLQLRWLIISLCLVKHLVTTELSAILSSPVLEDDHSTGVASDSTQQNQSLSIVSISFSNNNQSDSSNSRSKYVNKVDFRKNKLAKLEKSSVPSVPLDMAAWECPNITQSRNLECGCDMPHTLRCSGDAHSLQLIAEGLRRSIYDVSLLDCTLRNVSILSEPNVFDGISLQQLVVSSGEIKRVNRAAFAGIKTPLQTLGLPNNALTSVPMPSLAPLTDLDKLDLSYNRIKALQNSDFVYQKKLTTLDLSENQISFISLKALTPLVNLVHLKFSGNRLGDSPPSLKIFGTCLNLRELYLQSNSIRGALTNATLPVMKGLETLNLDKNMITSIHNGALEDFSHLIILSLRNNQIDVLQDHAFSGLSSLQILDLAHNGIVAISGSSLKHLPRLIVLDLSHNFLRSLTADIISPLPSLKELRLDGNEISIVAKNALYNASMLHSLSLQDNPLACDCTMKPFAEWLSASKISSKDLLLAVCTTPPKLEGAPLLQVPLDSLSCETTSKEAEKEAAFTEIENMLRKKNNQSYIKDISNDVRIEALNLTDMNDIHISWKLKSDEYSCRYLYILENDYVVFHSEISCIINGLPHSTEFSINAKVSGVFDLQSEKSYKMCLVMKEDISKDEYLTSCNDQVLPQLSGSNKVKLYKKELIRQTNESDVLDFRRITDQNTKIDDDEDDELSKLSTEISQNVLEYNQTNIAEHEIDKTLLSTLGIVVILTSFLAFTWGFIRLKNDRSNIPSVTTCYTVGPLNPDIDARNNRYFKLQATTSL